MGVFNAKEETEKVIQFVRDYYLKNNLGGAIIGISGGKDSAVVAAIMTEALGKENVLGVWMPCHSKVEDMEDTKLISDYYGFEFISYDLTNVYNTFKENLKSIGIFSEIQTQNSDISIKPRLRMTTLYYFAALYSEIKEKTIELRKSYNIKLPDAIIASTAIINSVPLLSADTIFSKITELNYIKLQP